MKKNVLALSITAAVIGLGFAGGAQAMTGALQGAPANSTLLFNSDGVGHMLLVPYYSAQAENSTLINLVNTDTVNGKAVKVRFRGAANSDDVFDFQVFLSPGDVFGFNVSKNSAGLAQFTTTDNSCTKPAKSVLNSTPFLTARLDNTLGAADKANGTREGYVEIFNMADIPKAAFNANIPNSAGPDVAASGSVIGDGVNDLFTVIKHVNKVAPCTGSAWTTLDTTNLSYADSRNAGLLPPTTGLMANTIIINVVGAAAFSASATAIQSVTPATGFSLNAVPSTGNVVYWPQTSNTVGTTTGSGVNEYTADPLLRVNNVFNAANQADTTPAVAAAFYDLPDMSTPYSGTANAGPVLGVRPLRQAADLTQAIATTSVTNEFLTDSTINAATDWTFSMPTRRYSVSLDYAAINATPGLLDDGRRFSDIFALTTTDANNVPTPSGNLVQAYFNANNTLVTSRQICVRNVVPTASDREETSIGPTGVVVSPSTPADPLTFCGEASVLSFNRGGVSAAGTGALKAQVSVKDLDAVFVDGWMRIATPSATAITGAVVAGNVSGLPILGSSYNRASAGGVQTFGASHAHRFGR